MSNFDRAINTLKVEIQSIGERAFSTDEAWIKNPTLYPSYSDNCLQSAWNIAHALSTKSYFHLLRNYSALTKWFEYFEKDTGTLKIIDEKTYRLGSALRVFLDVITRDPEAKSLLLGEGINRLRGILDELTIRLSHYDEMKREAARIALNTYEQRLNAALTAQPEIHIPDFIINDGGTFLNSAVKNRHYHFKLN